MRFHNFIPYCLLLVSLNGFSQVWNQTNANGVKQGMWRGYYAESKRLRYEGQFDNGIETGVFKFYDDTKAQTVIATRDFSKRPGSAYTIFFDQKGNKVSEGYVKDKKYDGLWTYYHLASKQIMTKELYHNGALDSIRTVYYSSGKVAEQCSYKEGSRHGSYKKFTETGLLLEDSNYVSGKFEGPASFFDGSGKIASKGIFKNGAKHGIWEFYVNGVLQKTEKYPRRKSKLNKAKAAAVSPKSSKKP